MVKVQGGVNIKRIERAFFGLYDRILLPFYSQRSSAITCEAEEILDSVDVVCFDVFDTLLLRKVWCPSDVFLMVERECNKPGFAKARISAERMAFKMLANVRDPTLMDIYSQMPEFAECYDIELRTERSVLTGNAELLRFWKKVHLAGKRIVVASDMYLPVAFVKKVLEEEGFSGAELIAVSCEENCRKSDGRLFDSILKRIGVEPKRVLHIGDNVRSDYIMPRKKGCRVWLYKRPQDEFLKAFPFANRFCKRYVDFEHRQFLATLITLWYNWQKKATYGTRIGFLFGGPLLVGFVDWLHKEAQKDGVVKLLFIARDGWMPERVMNAAFGDVATEYVYAPRIVSAFLDENGGADEDINGEKSVVRSTVDLNHETIVREYLKYVKSLSIQEKGVGVVDGPSKSFSGQTLLETGSQASLNGYYVNIVGENDGGRRKSWGVAKCPFFVEQLMSSPEFPIKYVQDGSPVYNTAAGTNEEITRRFFNEICIGEEACAVEWLRNNMVFAHGVTAEIVGDWMEAFSDCPARYDLCKYEELRHPVNILQSQYKPVFPTWSTNRCKRLFLLAKNWLFVHQLVVLKRERKNGYLIRRVYVCGTCVLKKMEKEM